MTTTTAPTPAPAAAPAIPVLCRDNPTPPAAGRASTNNWDTAFALNFANANLAIKAQKSSPPSFSGTKPGGGFSGPAIEVAGTFGDWQLSGGSGSLAELTLPISGNATAQATPPISLPFKGSAVIQISLQYLPQPGASVPTSNATGGTTDALKPKLTTTDPATQPIVSIITLTLNPEAADAKDAVSDVLETWLLANLESFNHTFAAIDLGAVADKGQFQWLVPTMVGYGINNPVGTKPDDYVFGVMAMTEGRTAANLGHDVSPNIIPSGCNAGFLISQERFLEKIMKPGISKLFLKASTSDFQVSDDGSTITNLNRVYFHDFTTASKSGDTTVDITGAYIDIGKFTLIANTTTLSINFIDLKFPWSGGDYTVHLDYTGESELYMDSGKRFQACTVTKPVLTTSVTQSSASKWTNLVVGLVEGVAFAVAGAAIGGALGPVAEGAGEAIEEGGSAAADAVEDTGDALSFSADLPVDDDIPNLEEENSEADADAAEEMENSDNESYKSKFKGFFRRNWRKMLGMAIGGATAAVVAKLPDIMEAYSEKDLDNMPTLFEFVDNTVSPVAWPGQTGYTLENLALNESLQIGLNVQIASS
ncbi:TULIP family P47-like protein [Variovorax robiniae]|uniref:TULIP family P47-like protein n=1 Tax=Variovorax robiniae TaxID=1836199 RepID=A0ABU8X0L2_9BURK